MVWVLLLIILTYIGSGINSTSLFLYLSDTLLCQYKSILKAQFVLFITFQLYIHS